ncbi:MAG: hypothetical protein K0R90_1668 [Oscillospiraceae bacterium]|nr:hypothetical protein [Oscillospiraceae bacterium]
MEAVTLKDIARVTKISVSTVSRALRNPDKVSDKKCKIIMNAVEELGYIPNFFASNLKANDTTNIGFIINDVQNTFFNQIIRVVEDILTDYGYKLIISFGTQSELGADSKIKSLLSSSVKVILFSPNVKSKETERLLKQKSIYTLQLFTDMYEGFDSLIVDDYNGTYMATKRLLQDGHTKIMIAGFDNVVWRERLKGYIKAYKEADIPLDKNYICSFSNAEYLADKVSTKIMLLRPTALIPVADQFGVASIKAIENLNLKIPDDISLICYDDSVWADLLGVSVVTHPIEDLGKKIADMLIAGIRDYQNNPKITKEVIEPFILDRKSIKPHN